VSRVGGVSRTRAWRPTGALERRRDAQLCAPALGTACVRVQATGGAPRNRVGRAVNAGPGAHWSIQRPVQMQQDACLAPRVPGKQAHASAGAQTRGAGAESMACTGARVCRLSFHRHQSALIMTE